MEARNAVVTADDIAAHPERTLARRAAREFTPGEHEMPILGPIYEAEGMALRREYA